MLEELNVKYEEDLVQLDKEYKELLLGEENDNKSPLVVHAEATQFQESPVEETKLHAVQETFVEERRIHAVQMSQLQKCLAEETALRIQMQTMCEDQVMKMQNMWKEIWHLRKSLDRHLR
jgi:hypothetical protein